MTRPCAAGRACALIAVVIGGVLFVPWLPVMLYQSAHTGTPWAGPQRPTSIIATTLGDFGGGGFRDADFIGTLLAMLFALGLFGRGLSRDRIELDLRTEPQFRYEATVLALTLVIGAAAAYAASSAYASRYAAVFFPFFILIVAGGVSRFLGRWVRFGVLCVMLGLSLLGAYHGATAPRSQARQIATSVAEHAQPGDLVVYCPDQLGPAGSRVMPANLDQVVFPNFAPPERVDWVDYIDRNEQADATAFAAEAAARAGAGRGVFLVWNGEYRGVQGQCEAVLDGLSAARGGGQVLVPDGGRELLRTRAAGVVPSPDVSRARRVGDDILAVLPAWIVARVLVAAAYVVAIVIADRLTPGARPHQISEGLIAWDGTWYRDIATGGYAQTGLAGLRFFPLLPLLGRAARIGDRVRGGARVGGDRQRVVAGAARVRAAVGAVRRQRPRRRACDRCG